MYVFLFLSRAGIKGFEFSRSLSIPIEDCTGPKVRSNGNPAPNWSPEIIWLQVNPQIATVTRVAQEGRCHNLQLACQVKNINCFFSLAKKGQVTQTQLINGFFQFLCQNIKSNEKGPIDFKPRLNLVFSL